MGSDLGGAAKQFLPCSFCVSGEGSPRPKARQTRGEAAGRRVVGCSAGLLALSTFDRVPFACVLLGNRLFILYFQLDAIACSFLTFNVTSHSSFLQNYHK